MIDTIKPMVWTLSLKEEYKKDYPELESQYRILITLKNGYLEHNKNGYFVISTVRVDPRYFKIPYKNDNFYLMKYDMFDVEKGVKK